MDDTELAELARDDEAYLFGLRKLPSTRSVRVRFRKIARQIHEDAGGEPATKMAIEEYIVRVLLPKVLAYRRRP